MLKEKLMLFNLMFASFLLNDSSKTLPNIRSNTSSRVSHHLVEIDGENLTLLNDLLATDVDSVDITSSNTEVKLPWEVTSIKISGRVVVKKEEISEAARLKTANRVLEELAGNEGVVTEEKVERLHGANTRILSLKLVDEAAATILLKHIVCHTISTKTNADALCNHIPNTRNTDSIVLVALRVSNNVGVSASDDVNFIIVKEDTVTNNGVLTEDAELLKTRDATHSVNTHALVFIILTFSNMDVETSIDTREFLTELLDLLDRFLQSFITAGERCMKTESSTRRGFFS